MSVWESFTNQKQWEAYLKKLIKTNEKALLKSILLIYDNQTNDEKEIGKSVEDNKVGFSKWDAEEMSDIAKKLKQNKELSLNEIVHARLVMPKYWKQLMIISKRNMELEKELSAIKQVVEENTKTFDETAEKIRQCFEEGKACDYGICNECPYVLKVKGVKI